MKNRKKDSGFTLLEVLVTCALILILTALLLPRLLGARDSGRETSAAAAVKGFENANAMYDTRWGNGFAPAVANFGGAAGAAPTCDAAQLLDPAFVTAMTKDGYAFTYLPVGTAQTAGTGCTNAGFPGFVVVATPTNPALHTYCVDENNTLHSVIGGTAPTTDAACDALPSL